MAEEFKSKNNRRKNNKNRNKKFNFNNKKRLETPYIVPAADQYPPYYEYKMPRAFFEDLAAESKKINAGDVYRYAVNYINDLNEYRGTCVRVLIGD